MSNHKLNWPLVGKLLLTIVLLSALCIFAGTQIAPQATLATVVWWVVRAAAALVGLLAIAVLIELASLGSGRTDPQWFWFPGEPASSRPGMRSTAGKNKEKGSAG